MPPSWPYRFLALSPAEIQHRRELLDLRGYYAQLSAIAIVLLVRVYRSCILLPRESGNGNSERRPFPRPKSWWDMPPCQGWRETRKQYMVTLLWLGWLLGLSVWGAGYDYLHLTKALGHIAISQLPFQTLMAPVFYLSTKPTLPSLLSLLTSIPQQTLTPYHRLYGRIVLSPLLLGHAGLYLSFFFQSSHPEFGTLLAKRVRDPDVQWGIVALCSAVSILIFTRPSGGQKRGSWMWRGPKTTKWGFYVGHVSFVAAFCTAVYSHVGYTRAYILETLIGSVLNVVVCWLLLKKVLA
ncbi:hypothetical protein MPDQ_007585 [Monascus purpureus]|uniref:Ferric oxidoreductase domain-containing protein n=1 Tax=Monascus purpureus TaxID=5098 RepID=A0A507QRW2_MONPU|nr:hypothetical protein MPDQ_007585 [Monascus purpureus]BDD59346.1 hypothetical protein MAP00_004556 [Monascus purpureus]